MQHFPTVFANASIFTVVLQVVKVSEEDSRPYFKYREINKLDQYTVTDCFAH